MVSSPLCVLGSHAVQKCRCSLKVSVHKAMWDAQRVTVSSRLTYQETSCRCACDLCSVAWCPWNEARLCQGHANVQGILASAVPLLCIQGRHRGRLLAPCARPRSSSIGASIAMTPPKERLAE